MTPQQIADIRSRVDEVARPLTLFVLAILFIERDDQGDALHSVRRRGAPTTQLPPGGRGHARWSGSR